MHPETCDNCKRTLEGTQSACPFHSRIPEAQKTPEAVMYDALTRIALLLQGSRGKAAQAHLLALQTIEKVQDGR